MVGLRYIAALAATFSLAASAPLTMAKRQAPSGVPQYVLDHAPLVYIDEDDPYFPSDIGAQLTNTHPTLNGTTPVSGAPSPLTLDNLDQLNKLGGKNIYLTTNEDFSKNPAFLNGVKPNADGKTEGAVSCAIIVHDRGNGTVDAFYMYFYAYNKGDIVFGQELGDHIGDWEHNMIRFQNGSPDQVWYSEHANGEAFTWDAVEKQGDRMIAFSGRGTHANWATTGKHDHAIPDVSSPIGFLTDTTSKGPLWDPTLSTYYYSVSFPTDAAADDSSNPTFTAYNAADPVGWLYFTGAWGDKELPTSDSRQKEFFGFKKYTSGPTGPRDKHLNRAKICPNNGNLCIVRPFRTPGV